MRVVWIEDCLDNGRSSGSITTCLNETILYVHLVYL